MFKSSAPWQPFIILLGWSAILLWFAKSFGGLHSSAELLKSTEWLDVEWYKAIALRGYFIDPSIPDGQSTVFFPLFPLMVAPFIQFFSLSPILALHLVQKVALVGMTYLIFRWARQVGFSPQESLLAILLHPALVFLIVPYTEALYLVCLFALILAWNKRNTIGFMGAAFFLGLCRPTGLFLIPAAGLTIAFLSIQTLRAASHPLSFSITTLGVLWHDKEFRQSLIILSMGAAAALAALVVVAFIMHLSVGDWYAFYRYRSLWKEEPGLRNLVTFLNLDFGQNTGRILVSWAALWGAWLLISSKRVFEGILCLVSILLPVYQGKIGDIIRYTMGAAPAWIILFERYKNSRVWVTVFVAFNSMLGFHYLYRWIVREWPG